MLGTHGDRETVVVIDVVVVFVVALVVVSDIVSVVVVAIAGVVFAVDVNVAIGCRCRLPSSSFVGVFLLSLPLPARVLGSIIPPVSA